MPDAGCSVLLNDSAEFVPIAKIDPSLVRVVSA